MLSLGLKCAAAAAEASAVDVASSALLSCVAIKELLECTACIEVSAACEAPGMIKSTAAAVIKARPGNNDGCSTVQGSACCVLYRWLYATIQGSACCVLHR
eukprot:6483-Heterococcus_DN1.PRE.3